MFWTRRLLALDLPPLVRSILAATATNPSRCLTINVSLNRPVTVSQVATKPSSNPTSYSAQRCLSNPEAVQNASLLSSHRSESYCSHLILFAITEQANLLWMNPCALQLLVNVYSTVSQTFSRSVLCAFLPVHQPLNRFQRLPLNELSSLSPLTESGPTASEDTLPRIRGGSSKASLIFCSFPFSLTRDQPLLQLLALAHSSLLTQPNE